MVFVVAGPSGKTDWSTTCGNEFLPDYPKINELVEEFANRRRREIHIGCSVL
jgi:hypothetical protein